MPHPAGSVALTCHKPPIWSFHLAGPSYGASMVKSFLDFLLTLVINNILVYPQRLLIPIMRQNPEVIAQVIGGGTLDGSSRLFARPPQPGYPEADTAVNISTFFTQMARMNSHCGIIKIEVLQARGLIPVTMLGMAHPYVELTADGEKGCRRAGPRNRPRFT